MAGEWTEAVVGDVATRVTKGTTPTTIGGQFCDQGINFVKVESITSNGQIEADKLAHIDEVTNSLLARSVLEPDDILFTIAGTIGRVAMVPERILPANTNQAVAIVRPNRELVLPRFLYYVLRDEVRIRDAHSRIVQSVQANFSLSELSLLEIPLPPLAEQRRIAHILGTLDDKIELNRRMNETLEAIARALFKSWFVDFDPVRAKAEGRDTGLPAHIADLFPDSFEDSELGEIPSGWRISNVGDIADVADCLHSKKPERRLSGRPLLQLANIRDDGLIDMGDTYFIDDADYQRWISRMEAVQGDCVITNVGRVGAVAQMPSGISAALGRNMTGVRCTLRFPYPTFLLECLLSEAMRDQITLNTDTGTILDALNVRSIPKLQFTCPPTAILQHFEQLARPLRGRMEQNLLESSYLSLLRDTLLPKLTSGELRVTGVERVA